jgi:trimethylamine--corrinoid protein Co-methyltransferase
MDTSLCETNTEDIAISAIKEVGHLPGANYFSAKHTQERYENAFYSPLISDWTNYEAWNLNGGNWTAQRAHKMYKQIIKDFQPPPIDEAIKEELKSFVARRKSEGGAPTDF